MFADGPDDVYSFGLAFFAEQAFEVGEWDGDASACREFGVYLANVLTRVLDI